MWNSDDGQWCHVRMSFVDRLDHTQRRFPVLGFPIAVIYKFFDDGGPYLCSLIAYYAFVSVFPVLLLLTTILSVVLVGHADWQERIINSAVSQLPVIGAELGTPRRLSGGAKGVTVGVIASLYGSLGVAQSLQYAFNTMWSVPRNSRPNPFKQRALSFLLLVVAAIAIIAATALSTIGSSDFGPGGTPRKVMLIVGSLSINAALFMFALRIATGRHLRWRQVLPGAVLGSIVYQALQVGGAVYVRKVVATASTTNSIFALVIGLLAFLHVAAYGIILAAEVNVVRVDRLWPRALLTPFTDNVDLTPGDQRSYTNLAKTQRTKGQQIIDVRFGQRPTKDPGSDN